MRYFEQNFNAGKQDNAYTEGNSKAQQAQREPRGRTTARGLEKGSYVRVKGLGKHGRGYITGEPTLQKSVGSTDLEPYITIRCDFNMGEHLVQLSKVKLVKRKTQKNVCS